MDTPTAEPNIRIPARAPAPVVGAGGSELAAASALARDTLSHFWEHLEKPQPGESRFSLKVRITDGVAAEEVWLSNVARDNGQATGEIANEPGVVKSVKYGARIPVPDADIADWFYFRGDKMVGNFTARVLVKTMPPAEADQYRRMFSNVVPLKIRCACGQKYAFEVEPVGGRMPYVMKCPACGADGTPAANGIIQQVLGAPPPPVPMQAAAPVAIQSAPPPPALSTSRQYAPPRSVPPPTIRSNVPKSVAGRKNTWGSAGGYTAGGAAVLLLILRIGLRLAAHYADQKDQESERQKQEQQFQQIFNQPAPSPTVQPHVPSQNVFPQNPYPPGTQVQVRRGNTWTPAQVVNASSLSVTARIGDRTYVTVPVSQVRAAN